MTLATSIRIRQPVPVEPLFFYLLDTLASDPQFKPPWERTVLGRLMQQRWAVERDDGDFTWHDECNGTWHPLADLLRLGDPAKVTFLTPPYLVGA